MIKTQPAPPLLDLVTTVQGVLCTDEAPNQISSMTVASNGHRRPIQRRFSAETSGARDHRHRTRIFVAQQKLLEVDRSC